MSLVQVCISTFATFDVTNALPGTIMVDSVAGNVYVVRLVGAVRSLVQVGTGGTPATLTRTLGLLVTPGAGGSGDVTYQCTVQDGNGVAVPLACVFIGLRRLVGVGALSTLFGTGVDISNVESNNGAALGIVGQTDAAGVLSFVLSGTPADSVDASFAVDAPDGGVQSFDVGRILP